MSSVVPRGWLRAVRFKCSSARHASTGSSTDGPGRPFLIFYISGHIWIQQAKPPLANDNVFVCFNINGTTIYRPTYHHRKKVCLADKTMLPTPTVQVPQVPVVIGGEPITKELAIELECILFGIPSGHWTSYWLKSGLHFREPGSSLSYGLIAYKNEIKGFVVCIQAYVLKQLLFQTRPSAERVPSVRLLRPTKAEQDEALVHAIADVMNKVATGSEKDSPRFILCLPQDNRVYFSEDSDVATDGVIERLHLFEFTRLEDLQDCLRRYLHIFLEPTGPACLLLLYSLVLSKGFSTLRRELDGTQDQLLVRYAECSQALVNLLLTGRATPFLHNGIVMETDEEADIANGDGTRKARVGILDRSEFGLLMWQHHDHVGGMIGSRLKTPRLPIWVTRTVDQYGLLFNPNRELTRDYHAENHFELHYYSSNRGQTETTILNIDTRVVRSKEERDTPLLERLILSKWHDAKISWNGTTPFV